MDQSKIIMAIIAIITTIISAGLIFKFVRKKKVKSNSGSVTIKSSKIDGDVAGRDMTK